MPPLRKSLFASRPAVVEGEPEEQAAPPEVAAESFSKEDVARAMDKAHGDIAEAEATMRHHRERLDSLIRLHNRLT